MKKSRRPRAAFDRLPCRSDEGGYHAVVETPRLATCKIAWDPKLGAFSFQNHLPEGNVYPFDWGFVPGTLGEDGDPLDALILHDAATWPGVVLRCRTVAVLRVDQIDKGRRIRNDRVVLEPVEKDREAVRTKLTKAARREIADFFLRIAFEKGKSPRVLGWKGRKAAERLIERLRTPEGRRAGRSMRPRTRGRRAAKNAR